MQFSCIAVVPKYLNIPAFWMIYYVSLCYDFVLHFGDETWTCTMFSLHLLLESNIGSVNFTEFVFWSDKLTSSAQTNSRCVSLNSIPSWFCWTFLVAYSKAKLKSNDDKASHSFSAKTIYRIFSANANGWWLSSIFLWSYPPHCQVEIVLTEPQVKVRAVIGQSV